MINVIDTPFGAYFTEEMPEGLEVLRTFQIPLLPEKPDDGSYYAIDWLGEAVHLMPPEERAEDINVQEFLLGLMGFDLIPSPYQPQEVTPNE